MDDTELAALFEWLTRPTAIAPADGLPVVVTAIRLEPDVLGDDQLAIEYQVPPLPKGVARQPLPGPRHRGGLTIYAAEVAEELQAWATEHVRKYRPLRLPDRHELAKVLPTAAELWQRLRQQFTNVCDIEGGFVGTVDGDELQVIITPTQWQALVIDAEIGCRLDHGVDANRTGDGPTVALEQLAETTATLDRDETFLVFAEDKMRGSTRAELPLVRGTANQREVQEILRQGGGTWHATRPPSHSDDRG